MISPGGKKGRKVRTNKLLIIYFIYIYCGSDTEQSEYRYKEGKILFDTNGRRQISS